MVNPTEKCSNCSEEDWCLDYCDHCKKGFCDNCWASNRATLFPKTKNTIVKNIDTCSDCHKIQWFKSEYGYMYAVAVRHSKEKNRNIWFDPRWWKEEDTYEFFQDLDYVNSHVYECVVKRIASTKVRLSRREKSRKKYMQYCRDQYYLVNEGDD